MPPQLAGDSRNTRDGGGGSRRRTAVRRAAAFRAAAGLRTAISAGQVTGRPRDEQAGKNERHGGENDGERHHRNDEGPVARGETMFLVGMPLEERHVAQIRLPAEVEQVAGERNRPDDRIDTRVENHARQHNFRHAYITRLPQQHDRKQRRHEIANPRHQADDRVESYAVRGAGQHERRIQQLGHASQGREPDLLALRQWPQSHALSYRFSPHRISTAPTVKPAPTEASRSKSPSFKRLCSTASLSANGIVPPVVLPKRSILMTTFSCGMPSRSVADKMMRRFAWCETNKSISHGLTPLRSR